jgi:hypothetical protein
LTRRYFSLSLFWRGNIDGQVDLTKVNVDVIKPWITRAVIDLLGFEDDVVIDYTFSLLEDTTTVHPRILKERTDS